MAGQGRHSRNRLRMPENDLGCLLNHAKRLRNGKVMAFLVQTTLKRKLVVCDGKRQKKEVPEEAPRLGQVRTMRIMMLVFRSQKFSSKSLG